MIYRFGNVFDRDRPCVLFDNALSRATVTANAGVPLNAVSPETFDFWQPGQATNTLTAVLPAAEWCDALAVVAHNFGTAGSTITVQNWDGSAWLTIGAVTPPDDQPFLILWEPRNASEWRVQITQTTAFVGVLTLGRRLIIPGYVAAPYVPAWGAQRIEVLGGVSRGGQFLGQRIVRAGADFQVSFTPFDIEWVSDDARAFMRHYNEGRPFMWASSPSEFPEDVAYCWRAGEELRPTFRDDSDLMDLSLSVSAYVEP